MIIWVEENNHLRVGDADNGWPLYSYLAFAPQNEAELEELKAFAEKYGYGTAIPDSKADEKETQEGDN